MSNEEGKITSANSDACKAFGYSTLVGLPITALMPSPFSEQHDSFLRRRSHGGPTKTVFPISVTAKRADGSIFPVSISMSSLKGPGGSTHFIALIEALQSTHMGIVINSAGMVMGVTSNFTQVFGWADEDLSSSSILTIVPNLPINTLPRESGAKTLRGSFFSSLRSKWKPVKPQVPVGFHRLIILSKPGDPIPCCLFIDSSGPREYIVLLEKDVARDVFINCEKKWQGGSVSLCLVSVSESFPWVLGLREKEVIGKDFSDLIRLDVGVVASVDEMLSSVDNGNLHFTGVCGIAEVRLNIEIIHVDHQTVGIKLRREGTDSPLKHRLGVSIKKEFERLPNLGYYHLGHKVGEGGFGSVYQATHVLTQMPVAIKIMDQTACAKKLGRCVPTREIAIHATLLHENIAMLYDVIFTTESMIIVQELLAGGDLYAKMHHAKFVLPEAEIRQYLFDVARGLQYLHSVKVAHRDLKLENLVLGSNGHVKIIDFGLAIRFREGELLHGFCGTADYAAPEMFLSIPYNGPSVDCWSLGVVTFVLVTGCFPFSDPQMTIDGLYEWPEHSASDELKAFVSNLLCLEPEKRISVHDSLRGPWLRSVNSNLEDVMFRSDDGVQSPCSSIVLRNDILGFMYSKFGFESHTVISSLQMRLCNQLSTTYKLLALKFANEAISDVHCSNDNQLSSRELFISDGIVPISTGDTVIPSEAFSDVDYLIVHPNGIIVDATDDALTHFGWSKERLIGFSFVSVLPLSLARELQDGVKSFLSNKGLQRKKFPVYILRGDDTITTGSLMFWEEGRYFVLELFDTGSKTSEDGVDIEALKHVVSSMQQLLALPESVHEENLLNAEERNRILSSASTLAKLNKVILQFIDAPPERKVDALEELKKLY